MTAAGVGGLLAMLQLADSSLPVGRFVHSQGLESWLAANPEADEARLVDLVGAVLREGVAPLDGAAVANAHPLRCAAALVELDRMTTLHKLTPGARLASHACGRQLLALGAELTGGGLVAELAALVRRGESDGNAAVALGVVAAALGVGARDSVLIELRGAAAALLGVAVRLGRLAPRRAQRALLELGPSIAEATRAALELDAAEMWSSTPELELAMLSHGRAGARFFRT
jgi:urease accessory protein